MTYTVSFDPILTFIAETAERTFEWQTDSNTNEGIYPLTVTATGPDAVTDFVTFNLQVKINCLMKTVTTPMTVD